VKHECREDRNEASGGSFHKKCKIRGSGQSSVIAMVILSGCGKGLSRFSLIDFFRHPGPWIETFFGISR
jgi:hypothetical protein